MKKSTKERIAENHDRKKLTYIGRYAYDLQYNSGAHADYIIRCPREDVGREWIGFNGEYINGWEFVEPYFD